MGDKVLLAALICLGILSVAALVRAVIGPRFTDRIVAVNAVNTMVIAMICILSDYLAEDYLLDIALIYALLGFVANTLLMRNLYVRKKQEEEK